MRRELGAVVTAASLEMSGLSTVCNRSVVSPWFRLVRNRNDDAMDHNSNALDFYKHDRRSNRAADMAIGGLLIVLFFFLTTAWLILLGYGFSPSWIGYWR